MIRILFKAALPVLGLGLAAAFLAPELVSAPRGEALVVASPSNLHQASFQSAGCGSVFQHADRPPFDFDLSETRIVALALHEGKDSVVVAIGGVASQAGEEIRTVFLVFDEMGRLIAAGDPKEIGAEFSAGDCDAEAELGSGKV
jgi:hypothetical protein